jgi:hypothetical protein
MKHNGLVVEKQVFSKRQTRQRLHRLLNAIQYKFNTFARINDKLLTAGIQ